MSEHMIGGILISLSLFLLVSLMLFVSKIDDIKAASQNSLSENLEDE